MQRFANITNPFINKIKLIHMSSSKSTSILSTVAQCAWIFFHAPHGVNPSTIYATPLPFGHGAISGRTICVWRRARSSPVR
ncbi:MAG: hypothetical protein GPOALKHO_001595 [Sodalis sp.]|nr:MAG: hypothetical protein GPOALKHO_001595 [Sodalis sp.]